MSDNAQDLERIRYLQLKKKKAESAPIEKEEPYSLKQAGRDLVKGTMDIAKVPADFLNQVAFDVPRQALERFGGKGAWEANFGVSPALEPIQKLGGAYGALQSGGALLKGAGRLAQVARGAGVPVQLTRGVAKGALAGGAEGAIRQENLDYTPESVGTGAAIGAAIGGGLVPVAQGIGRGIQKTFSGVPKTFGEFLDNIKTGTGVKIKQKLTPEEQLKVLKADERRLVGQGRLESQAERVRIREDKIASAEDIRKQKEYVQAQVDSATGVGAKLTAEKNAYLKQIREEGKTQLETAKKKLEDLTTSAVRGTNEEIQRQLPSVFTEASSSFGTHLNAIDQKRVLSEMDVRAFFQDVLNDSSVRGGKAFDAIAEKAKKYGVKITWEGNIPKIGGLTKPVKVSQLLQDIKDVGSTLSSSAKSGGRWTQDDIPYAVMNDRLAGLVPELAELRSSYRPILLAMKESARIFKPSMGEAKTAAGEMFLKRVATGKTRKQDEWLLKMIEQPTKFTSGLGKVTGEVQNVGAMAQRQLSSIESATANKIKQIETKYEKKMSKLREDSAGYRQRNRELQSELAEVNKQAELARIAVAQGDIGNKQEMARKMAIIADREVKLMKIRNAQRVGKVVSDTLRNTALATIGLSGVAAGMRYGAGRGTKVIEDVGNVTGGN